MISQLMSEMINRQINAELWSAYLYQAMSLDLESKNLSGMAKWFSVQAQEELQHAHSLEAYLNGQNAKVELFAIDKVPTSWSTPLEMMEAALDHEMAVTEMINNLMKQANKEQDFATQHKLMQFVDEQMEEEALFHSMVYKFRETQRNPCLTRILDQQMHSRKLEQKIQGRAEHWL
ncbi:MAG: ferritin [Prevotellaceae bacterium]|nr:ferritin [Candidatus Minthosoma caballi]